MMWPPSIIFFKNKGGADGMRHHSLYPLKCKRNICLYGLALVASPSNGVKVLSAYLKSEGEMDSFEMRWFRAGTAFMCKLRSG